MTNNKDNFIRNTIVTGAMIIIVICVVVEYKHYRLSSLLERAEALTLQKKN